MIPFDGRGILLDIEGTTSSISFVHEVMFPFVRVRLDEFLGQHFTRADVVNACDQIARDAGHHSVANWFNEQSDSVDSRGLVRAEVIRLMDGDVKATGLKALQGLIWESGFRSGQLRAHVYPDVLPAIERWRAAGIDIRIFSSGSIAAQKLFFGHLEHHGDCLHFFSGFYDTTIGSKKEPSSYAKISTEWNLHPREILFLSDLAPELEAASSAGLQVAASIRPGNAPLPKPFAHPQLNSFEDVSVVSS